MKVPAFPVAALSAVPASRGEARQRLTSSSPLSLCAIKFETKGFLSSCILFMPFPPAPTTLGKHCCFLCLVEMMRARAFLDNFDSLTLVFVFFFLKSVVMEMHSFGEEGGAKKNIFVITFKKLLGSCKREAGV